ncbi:MAG: ParA family protein [Chloroflexota bacterium]|nr:ParA family protein [Chloroflexota bacterium]
MIISVVGYKGGVAKTTTAIHLAAYMQMYAPTVLADGDANRSCFKWAQGGKLPYPVIEEASIAKYARTHEHIVIDTAARPTPKQLQDIAEGSDFLIVPTSPDELAVDALVKALDDLRQLNAARYKVLVTMVQPLPNKDGPELMALLQQEEIPHFSTFIRFRSAFKKAVRQGVPVYDVIGDPRAQEGWDDYKNGFSEIPL